MHSAGTRRMCTIPQTLSRACMKGAGHETSVNYFILSVKLTTVSMSLVCIANYTAMSITFLY